MADQAPIIGSFAGGEITPYMVGRVDHSRYYVSCRIAENVLVMPQGPVEKRGGRRFVVEVKNSADPVRVLRFKFSTEQAYTIEAGPYYFRFCMGRGQILSGGVPYEIATPYSADDLADIRLCQSYDIVWVLHPKHAPRKLSRTGHTSWTMTVEEFKNGPYLDENTTATTVAAAAVTGSAITLTASAVTGINDNAGFSAADVGRLIRIGHTTTAWVANTAYTVGAVRNSSGYVYRCTTAGTSSSTTTLSGTGEGIADGSCVWKQIGSAGVGWGWARITAVTSTTQISIDIKDDLVSTAATNAWRLGLWSDGIGWPSSATFHQDRLWYGSSTKLRPHRLDGSAVGDFSNFAPGTNDADAIAISLGSDDVVKIRWLVSARVLLVGTSGGEFVVTADSVSSALTPTNIQASPHTLEGCADAAPVKTGAAVLFVQYEGRKIHELKYSLDVDGYIAPELSLMAEQATRGGFVELDWQKQPSSIVWGVRKDGELTGCTYLPAQEVAGFHRHPADGVVESIAVIPGASGSDELWMLVARKVNGQTRRYIEVQEDPLPLDGKQSDAFYVDSGLSLINAIDAGLTVGAVSGAGVAFAADADVFDPGSVDREIHHDHQVMERIDGRLVPIWKKARARITEVIDSRHVLADIIVAFPDKSVADGIAASDWRLTVREIAGLDHLEGRTVQALLDGGVQPDRVVTGGRIDLDWDASKIHVGLGYSAVLAPMPLEVGAQRKRVSKLRVRMLRSLGGWVGRNDSSLEQILWRSVSDPLDAPPPLFSGDRDLSFPGDWQEIADLLLMHDLPLPFTVAAVIPEVETSNG